MKSHRNSYLLMDREAAMLSLTGMAEKKLLDIIAESLDMLSKVNPSTLTAFLGFDACIDSIVKIVSNITEGGKPGEYFDYQ